MRPTPQTLYKTAFAAYRTWFPNHEAKLLAIAEAGYRISMLQKLNSIEETAQALKPLSIQALKP